MVPKAKKLVKRRQPQQTIHAPTTETVVTLKHSVELVRTVITATISHIVWTRSIFPPEVKYALRTYDPVDPDMTYDGFVSGAKRRKTFDATEDLMTWHVLKRGQGPGVDKLLDCLEIGAADALEKGFLAKLTLSLHHADGPIADTNLFEAYAMTFTYGSDDRVSKLSSVTREGGKLETNSVVMFDAKTEVKTLVDDISSSIMNTTRAGGVEKLPEQFQMSIAMLYNDKAPPDYQPPNFKAGSDSVSRIIEMSAISDNIKMKTRFHEVAAGHGVRHPSTLNSVSQSHSQDHPSKALNSSSPTAGTNPVRLAGLEHHPPQRHVSISSDLGDTQPEAVQQIRGMGFSRVPNSETQDTQRLDNSEPATPDHFSKPALASKTQALPTFPPYTQAVTTVLREHLLNSRSLYDNGLDEPYSQEKLCECNGHNSGDITTLCSFCKAPQHPECYGYLEDDQPQTFICYKCLLQDEDPERLDQVMKPLCIKRRALYYLQKKGSLYKLQELAQHLNRDASHISELLSELQKEGFVKGQGTGNKRGKPIFTYVGLVDNLRKSYFRPQQGIDHLFALPKKLLLTGMEVLSRSDSPSAHAVAGAGSPTHRHRSESLSVDYPQDPRHGAQRTIRDNSSTQGTPSPRAAFRRISYMANDDTTPKHLKLSEDFPLTSKKRRIGIGETEEAKCNNIGVRSPWFIDRRSQA